MLDVVLLAIAWFIGGCETLRLCLHKPRRFGLVRDTQGFAHFGTNASFATCFTRATDSLLKQRRVSQIAPYTRARMNGRPLIGAIFGLRVQH